MPNELDPIIGQWYFHIDKGQRFYVAAVDEESQNVEVQHFDGDLEEFTPEEWQELEIELAEEPENWTGALDVSETDDLGTAITDTDRDDWDEAQQEFFDPKQEKLSKDPDERQDDYGEGYMEEEPLGDRENWSEAAGEAQTDSSLKKRPDGVYEESFNEDWYAEYSEDPQTGLWRVDIFKHDVPEWRNLDFESLEEAVEAAKEYYSQV